ncbi:hypothetical protein CD30_19190 [Ureibacillus massiliensis 4400831 = CIP 108448 = CCUG 49529]|uniref:SLAP domain-containing protein n=1 Tax=Ureibacillus massiliensis 4400831 = CIP 108448 = CCUG 49529 TaxID=1211035 RepID=A0A0A3JE69_9BACL|nr:SLAP domain-containing protein [Ureibacillus massiliensis]KGR85297.1 hypothetical protein CD30_19190 [Ureibacillus massiliensis 4400831 = CIP 108448 = CCUG 49529]
MQQLQFETSWDKTLAASDRLYIEQIFNETKIKNNAEFLCSTIREATNYKEELLVTVLVHNFSEQSLLFINTKLRYSIQGEFIAEKLFTIPGLIIPPHISVPWTFIFPKDTFLKKSSYNNGCLEIL